MTQGSVKRANRSKKMLWHALKRKRRQRRALSTKDEQDNAHALTYENETKRSNNE